MRSIGRSAPEKSAPVRTAPERTAKDQALLRVGVREYGASEMRQYLKRKGYEDAEIQAAVSELVDEGLINDSRFSGVVARASANRSKGPGYIQAKLRQKGIRVDTARARELFQESSPESELELARRILESRYPRALEKSSESYKEKRRAYQGLIRRGISHEVARQCLKSKAEPETD